LQEARLDAITRIGELALNTGAKAVLIAGDVYDMEGLSNLTLEKPIERMRKFSTVEWHLIPGNHDSNRPDGLWDRLLRKSIPENIKIHLTPKPKPIANGDAWILPAPLQRRHSTQDLTAYMNDAVTPDGVIRVGLAHGSITTFSSDETANTNYISPSRAQEAGLAYLALGDWHGYKQINANCYYSGTPETDSFSVDGGYHALVVDLKGSNSAPTVEKVEIGKYRWFQLDMNVSSAEDIDVLENRIRSISDTLEHVLMRLSVSGTLSLADRKDFEERIQQSAKAALCYLDIDDSQLHSQPTEADLDTIDHGGFVRNAVNRLKLLADDPSNPESEIAHLALQRLYLEHLRQVSS
jgi:DNA repair exonuclease SbcCD nuclease subunit